MEFEAGSAAATEAGGRRKAQAYPTSPRGRPEFPGCRAITLTRDELAAYEGRFEFWDAATETAWVVQEPPGAAHEHPSQRLSALSEVIASVRGSAIECFGAMGLELRDEHGERQRIMQADQSVYLYPERFRLPDAGGMVVGEHDFPDVVLEVDHTTDVRRGKLWFYEEWGFPEVWVAVPERESPSRPAGRPGLTIHLFEGGTYGTARESRAFPGWTANEIHMALNEPVRSAATSRVLDRVGRALGARDGTGPDDTLWLRAHREEGHARGRAEGQAAGRAEGRVEGRAEARAEIVAAFQRKLLASRGDAGVSDEAIIDALLECEDQTDFWARIERSRR